MVLKTTLCRFSGQRIYPGRGIIFVRSQDSQQFLLINRKIKSLFSQKKKAAKLAWTAAYRKAHKKDQVGEVARKKRRNLNNKAPRAIVGVSMDIINKKRNERPEVRQANRETALREVRERMKKMKGGKKAGKR